MWWEGARRWSSPAGHIDGVFRCWQELQEDILLYGMIDIFPEPLYHTGIGVIDFQMASTWWVMKLGEHMLIKDAASNGVEAGHERFVLEVIS